MLDSKFRLYGTQSHEEVSRIYNEYFLLKKYLPHFKNKQPKGLKTIKKIKVMFYFFKNVHIPILIPIYKKMKEFYPEIKISFGYKSYEPRNRSGFLKKDLKLLKAYGEEMFINPKYYEPDITFIADSVYDWVHFVHSPFIQDRIKEVVSESENTILIIKLHGSTKIEYSNMYEKLARNEKRVFFVDALDFTPLIVLADIMISDVSSAIIEFAAKDKPVILFNNPNKFQYVNYDENGVEYKFRDIGIEVNDLNQMKEAVNRSFIQPEEFSKKRIDYTNLLIENKKNADACEKIVTESLKRFTH
ncbi:MAG: CDP-glycerol glycerophosphotransferase family protein [Pseudomonadales bacterium]|nr:CDP-glycerol glycerophosphotransferase family protein [Pseudomonadales bacterium]